MLELKAGSQRVLRARTTHKTASRLSFPGHGEILGFNWQHQTGQPEKVSAGSVAALHDLLYAALLRSGLVNRGLPRFSELFLTMGGPLLGSLQLSQAEEAPQT